MKALRIQGYGHSVIGGRQQNQDSFLVDNERLLFAVADGVGGGVKGDVASQLAVESFRTLAPEANGLRELIQKLNAQVLAEAKRLVGDAAMGTTFTGLRIQDSTATLGHVGDSHCYVVEEDCLKLLNQDHEFFDDTAGGTVLCSYLGLDPQIGALTIDEHSWALSPGQRILLCTDGLYRQLSEQRIRQVLNENRERPENLVSILCTEAAMAEGSDNVTVVYIEIE